MTKEERRALKQWLTDQLPEGTSREEIADELEVTRKTISTMLNPNAKAEALPVVVIAGQMRVPSAALDRWVRENEEAALRNVRGDT